MTSGENGALSRHDASLAMARLAAVTLRGSSCDEGGAALEAARRGLAGLYLLGRKLSPTGLPSLSPSVRASLERAARSEAVSDLAAKLQMQEVLELFAARALAPVVLKGRVLALSFWPEGVARPFGDLDLLLEQEREPEVVSILVSRGYRPVPPEPRRRGRVDAGEVVFVHPGGRPLLIEWHSRLFRSVGSGIEAPTVLRRALDSSLDGIPVRELDDADRTMFLLVHAAKHGVRRLKWVLDLYAVLLATPARVVREAAERARLARALRPFHAAAAIVTALPGLEHLHEALASTRPLAITRLALGKLVRLDCAVSERPLPRSESYLLEMLLEERPSALARMAYGVLVRRVGRALAGCHA